MVNMFHGYKRIICLFDVVNYRIMADVSVLRPDVKIVLFWVLFVLSEGALLQAQKFSFKTYQVDQGLSENTVQVIMQDDKGFLWFGTKDGLNRFDGHQYRIYKNNPQESHSLGNNFIRALYQDRHGVFWVGTDNQLYLFDPLTETFSLFAKTTTDGLSVKSAVTAICEDGKYIWIGTMTQGVFLYNTQNDSLIRYSFSGTDQSLPSDLVWRVFRDYSGTIWIGTRGGLSRYNRETGAFQTWKASGQPGDLLDGEILAITEDSNGDLWLGTWSGGLSKLNKPTGTFKTWFGPSASTYITHIRSIFEYDKDQLLIGSDDGLYLFDKVSGHYQRVDDPKDANSLSDQNVYAIFKDREGGLWIGTYFGGVNYVSPRNNFIEHYYPNNSAYSMSGKAVSQFCEDQHGNIWVATEDGGLNYFNTETRRFKVYQPKDGEAGLSYHNLHALVIDDNRLWIGTFSRGVDVLDLKTGSFTNFQYSAEGEHTIDDNCVFSIYKNRQDRVYIGTPFGLSVYDDQNKRFNRINEVRAFIYDMQEDPQGNLWVASYGEGLFCFNAASKTWKNYTHEPGNPRSISFNKITDIYLDDNQRLWFATEGRGIFKYNYETDDFTTISETDGLPNNVAYGILDDKFGNIWVSTNKGISRINPQTLDIKTYSREDGLQSNQFNYKSSLKASDGSFYFGGINGFNVFNPDRLQDNNYLPPVMITNIELFDADKSFQEDSAVCMDLRTGKKIVLRHNQASFRISFVSLSYMAQEKNQFAYMLENQNNKWIPAGNQKSVSYINLAPGEYVFRVKGSNNDGVWNETGDYVAIEILPPFWKSKIACAFYSFCLLVLLFFCIRYYIRWVRKKQKQRLDSFHKQKEKEMYDSKINFFTNIAHEIRTPVSLIKAPLECILKSNVNDGETCDNLKVIERNTDRLLDLVNQLLDFRKMEEKIYRINFTNTNLNQLINETSYRFKPAAESKNILIKSLLPSQEVFTRVDKEALTKVLSNLLTNALKYAKTEVRVQLENFAAEGFFQLTVSDDGPGVPKAFIEKVFEPFYQVDGDVLEEKKTGTGIGLALSKQLVERHQGSVFIKEDGCLPGANLVVQIPLNLQEEKEPAGQFDREKKRNDKDIPDNEPQAGRMNVLIVEDNEELRRFLERNLKHDFNVFSAENGQEALIVLEENIVDIAISDIVMPVMGGLELVRRIKEDEQHSHIPVVLLSARTNVETKIEGMECGADSYIEKPFSIEFLKAQVNSLLKNRLLIQEKFARSPFISFGSIANNKKDEDFINKLNGEIERNLSDPEYSIEKLSMALSVSRSNLQRKIKGLSGMTPNDYIRVFRLKKSAQLLMNGEYRINEICYLVGFNSPSYFSKCFQKQFGSLPKEFVKNQEQESN